MKTAIDSDYQSSYIRVSDRRGYSVSETTRIQEIENYGTFGQRGITRGRRRRIHLAVVQHYPVRGARWRSVCRTRSHRIKPRHTNFASMDYRADCTPRIYKFANNISSANRGRRTFRRGTSRLQNGDRKTDNAGIQPITINLENRNALLFRLTHCDHTLINTRSHSRLDFQKITRSRARVAALHQRRSMRPVFSRLGRIGLNKTWTITPVTETYSQIGNVHRATRRWTWN